MDHTFTFGTSELGDTIRSVVRPDDGSEVGSGGMTENNLIEKLKDAEYCGKPISGPLCFTSTRI